MKTMEELIKKAKEIALKDNEVISDKEAEIMARIAYEYGRKCMKED